MYIPATRVSVYEKLRAMNCVAQVTKVTSGNMNDTTGVISQSTTTHNGYGLIGKDARYRPDDSLVKIGDKEMILADYLLGCTPEPGDRITQGSFTYEIIKADALAPTGEVIFWRLTVRKA